MFFLPAVLYLCQTSDTMKYKRNTNITVGLIVGIVFLAIIFYMTLSPGIKAANDKNCLQSGVWQLKKVYLDSLLYVNGEETKLLQRLDVSAIFMDSLSITLDFEADINRKINNGTAQIQYEGQDYGIALSAEGLTREYSECHKIMRLTWGTTTFRGGKVQDTTQNANHISISTELNKDYEGSYLLQNDTLTNSYLPSWSAPFHPKNPANNRFINYRNGNKIFRFLWVKIKSS